MKQKYKFLMAGLVCSFGWIFVQAIYLYFISQFSPKQWLSLLPGLLICVVLVLYTIALFKDKVTIFNFSVRLLLVLYVVGLFIMLILGSLALINIAGYHLPENLVFPVIDNTDKYFWSFIVWATLGASFIQIIALIMSMLTGNSKDK